ncbi:uncharacterized protein LOC132734694 [Ruditapes philippinarum]|uniref:uncharacterized protein LOC132734694 n=1 Tax=Ruditapes philippinarum TaxID=129788 RepID=UPI00295B6C1A|nr:uncharacterized protein LOC132734694 [Ruditapes philippinarum]
MQLENDTLVIGKDDIRKVPDDVLDKMKAGLDEQYDGIELDMIKSKRFKLLSPVSKTAEGVRQILDCADASVRRINEERDKAIFRIKPSDKEQTDLAELGETLQKELKTTSKAEKEKHYIDFKQSK